MEEINIKSWKQYEKVIEYLDNVKLKYQEATSHLVSDYLFRGQQDSKWLLETTLDRFLPKEISIKNYYRLIYQVKPKIETFTGKQWDLPSLEEYSSWADNIFSPYSGKFKEYEYMAYLRHHGFPSPLLDWTASPYVAAFFAFRSVNKNTKNISIFSYLERPTGMKHTNIGSSYIRTLGPYVRSHKRHFYQQSQYTICIKCSDDESYYVKHQEIIEKDEKQQDLIWKINIPSTENKIALEKLNRMNINAFSLFGTEDSLLDTIATTDILLKGINYL
jgi:hypothetical protein